MTTSAEHSLQKTTMMTDPKVHHMGTIGKGVFVMETAASAIHSENDFDAIGGLEYTMKVVSPKSKIERVT